MFAKPILLFTLFPQILAKKSNTGEQDENIQGWINEPLHLDCSEKRIPKEEEYVNRQISEHGKGLERFVSSKWDKRIRNYTKVCNKDHSLYLFCSTQVTSYVTNENVTHFHIERASPDLNGRTTLCEFSSIVGQSGPDQTIIMRGRIKGYVNERIEMECPIRHRCNETDTVTLKINLIEVKTVDISHKNLSFHCRENDQYYDVCHDHMNSSYVNSNCSAVMFVFERTPVSLNITHLHCHVKFKDVEVDSDHDDIETIIFLQYQQNESTTTPPTDKKISNESTTNSAPNTTSPTKNRDKNHLISGIVVGIVIVLIIFTGVYIWKRNKKRNRLSRRRRHSPSNPEDNKL